MEKVIKEKRMHSVNIVPRDKKTYYDTTLSASSVCNLRTFEELMELSSIQKYFKFIDEEEFKHFNDLNYIPHYLVNGIKAFRSNNVIEWIKKELVAEHDGQRLVTKFLSYPQANKPPRKIPKELIGICGDLCEVGAPPPCVYFLIDKNKIVYVGQTVNIYMRMKDHEKNKSFNRVLYIPVAKEYLDKIERGYIDSLNPKYNLDGKTLKNRYLQKREVYSHCNSNEKKGGKIN